MPQLNKGGKFVFGLSVIHENLSVQFPPQAVKEYHLLSENKIIIFTGSKITGGFCVTSYPLLIFVSLHINNVWRGVIQLWQTTHKTQKSVV